MFEQLEARRDSNIILPPFRDRLLPDDIGAPYGMIVDRHAYASYQKHLPSVHIQGIPHDAPFLQVSGRNSSGPQQYAASKVDKEVLASYGVAPPSYQSTMTFCLPNARRPPSMIPPRFQKMDQHVAHMPFMKQPHPSLDYSPFPKQLGIPSSGQRPQTIYSTEPVRWSSSPLVTHDDSHSPEPPTSDMKSALRALGLQIGTPSTTLDPEPSTGQPHSLIDPVPTLPIPTLPPAALICDPCDLSGRKDTPKPFQVNLDGHMQASNRPTTPLEQPKQPASSQPPADQGGTFKPVGPVHVNLPPPSSAKGTIPNVQSFEPSGPRVSVENLEPFTMKPGTPEPPMLPITSNHVKLPPVQGRKQSSSLEPSMQQSSAPESSDTTAVDIGLSPSKNEMCRQWYIGRCDNGQCHYA
ncbi:hypothetical protein M405DRAFT_816357, partial [Rhizopogon salebrosus TDB-379]